MDLALNGALYRIIVGGDELSLGGGVHAMGWDAVEEALEAELVRRVSFDQTYFVAGLFSLFHGKGFFEFQTVVANGVGDVFPGFRFAAAASGRDAFAEDGGAGVVLGFTRAVGGGHGTSHFACELASERACQLGAGLWSPWLSDDSSSNSLKILISYLIATKNCYSFLRMEIELLYARIP